MKRLWMCAAFSVVFASAALADDAPADIWKAKCKGCHGESGNADTKIGHKEKIADFTSADFQQHMTDADIKKIITEGSEKNSKMKPFKEKLSPAEIDGMVKYIRTLGKK